MRVTNLHLKNFGSHADTKHEFVDKGIIGIVGPNGCGKSTLLSAMLFALTGDSGNDGKKEDDFNWEASAAAEGRPPGFVEMGFAHAGDTFLIKRNIRTATSSLKIGDAKAITGASKITAQIAKSLGVSPAILQDIVFVRQGKLEGALFERPSDRKRAFQQLFGTHRAEVIRDALGKELGNISDEDLTAIIQERQVSLDALTDQLRDAAHKADAAAIELETMNEAELRAQLADGVTKVNAAARAQKLEGSITQAQQANATRRATIASLDGEVAQAAGMLEELRLQYESTKDNLRQQGELARKAARQQTIAHEIVTLRAVLDEPEPEIPELTQVDLNALHEDLQGLNTQISVAQDFVNRFAEGKCPTCGQTVPDGEAFSRQHEATLAEKQPLAAAAQRKYSDGAALLRTFDAGHSAWTARRERVPGNIERLETENTQLGVIVLPTAEVVAGWEAMVRDFDAVQRQFDEKTRNKAAALTDAATVVGQLSAFQQELTQAQAAAKDGPGTEGIAKLEKELALIVTRQREASQLDGQVTQLRTQKAGAEADLEQMRARADAAGPLQKYRTLIEAARMVLHRDSLPAEVSAVFVREIQRELSTHLDQFDVPFAAEFAEDTSVLCAFPAKKDVPAARLSGGQKVMLSIAFRFAVSSRFASQLGLVALDEPTGYLDTDRISRVIEVLEEVRRHAHNCGMQVFIITHEQRLMGVFDQTIRVEG